jgi:hypothetical protein
MHATNSLRLIASLPALALVIAACGGSVYSVGSDRSAENGGTASSGGTTSGGTSSGGAADASSSCTKDSDCGAGHACGFLRADACAAKGTCFDTTGIAICNSYFAGCACDGSEINIACPPFPPGYESKPLLHEGKCTGGGADGAAPCTADKDCPAGFGCGFPQADGCSATGLCFDISGPTCAAYSAGCACDGTEINVACQPYPSGWFSKPLLHTGACK